MSVHDNIRLLREVKRWSQEDMAQRLNMSVNGYARIERGETKLHLDKLLQIADIFEIDVIELMAANDKGMLFLMNRHCDNMGAQYYGNVVQQNHVAEIEKLNLMLRHKDELIEQKNQELAALHKLVALLEKEAGAGKLPLP